MIFTWDYNKDKTLKRATLLQSEEIPLSNSGNKTITLKEGAVSAWLPVECEMDNSSWVSSGIVVLGNCSFLDNSIILCFDGSATITNVVTKNNVRILFCKNTKTSIIDCVFKNDCDCFVLRNDCFLKKSNFSQNITLRDCTKIVSSTFKNFVNIESKVNIEGANVKDFSDIGRNVTISGNFAITESTISNSIELSAAFFGLISKSLICNNIKIKGSNTCIKDSNIENNVSILGEIIAENSHINGENDAIKIDVSRYNNMALYLNEANILSQYDFFIYRTSKDEIISIYPNEKREMLYYSKSTEKAINILNKIDKINVSVRTPFKDDKYMGWAKWFAEIIKKENFKDEDTNGVIKYLNAQKNILFDIFNIEKIKDIEFLDEIILWNTLEFFFAVCSAQYHQQKYNITPIFNISIIKFTGAILSEDIVLDLKNKKAYCKPKIFINNKTLELLSSKLSLSKDEIVKKLEGKSILIS